jgi:hypothetical protein
MKILTIVKIAGSFSPKLLATNIIGRSSRVGGVVAC